MVAVRRISKHEWRAYRRIRLRALEDSPDSFGSTLESALALPEESWRDRVTSAAASLLELPLAVAVDDEFVGLAWGMMEVADPETAHVFQMWVAPEARGNGHGAALLGQIVEWARNAGAKRVILDVTCGNEAAERLYEGAGFRFIGEGKPIRPGASVMSRTMCLDL